MGIALSCSCGVLVFKSLGSISISGIFLGSRELKCEGRLSEISPGLSGLALLGIHYLNSGKDSISSCELLSLHLLKIVSDGNISVRDFQQDGTCIK